MDPFAFVFVFEIAIAVMSHFQKQLQYVFLLDSLNQLSCAVNWMFGLGWTSPWATFTDGFFRQLVDFIFVLGILFYLIIQRKKQFADLVKASGTLFLRSRNHSEKVFETINNIKGLPVFSYIYKQFIKIGLQPLIGAMQFVSYLLPECISYHLRFDYSNIKHIHTLSFMVLDCLIIWKLLAQVSKLEKKMYNEKKSMRWPVVTFAVLYVFALMCLWSASFSFVDQVKYFIQAIMTALYSTVVLIIIVNVKETKPERNDTKKRNWQQISVFVFIVVCMVIKVYLDYNTVVFYISLIVSKVQSEIAGRVISRYAHAKQV